jgi:hypothetical protein
VCFSIRTAPADEAGFEPDFEPCQSASAREYDFPGL